MEERTCVCPARSEVPESFAGFLKLRPFLVPLALSESRLMVAAPVAVSAPSAVVSAQSRNCISLQQLWPSPVTSSSDSVIANSTSPPPISHCSENVCPEWAETKPGFHRLRKYSYSSPPERPYACFFLQKDSRRCSNENESKIKLFIFFNLIQNLSQC
jgi:hypothetical protein